ncbi:hypothetical protein G6027_01855 [Dietzia sp. SLG310A2-38A2]|nr:hypothetical protein [Dietzia sp. SLG310A2-38A2]MBB1029656.1 hypothetical protein [Dietzia sp. SLG310A2-38A2]
MTSTSPLPQHSRDAESVARRRVLAMRATFRRHDEALSAVGFVLRKRG